MKPFAFYFFTKIKALRCKLHRAGLSVNYLFVFINNIGAMLLHIAAFINKKFAIINSNVSMLFNNAAMLLHFGAFINTKGKNINNNGAMLLHKAAFINNKPKNINIIGAVLFHKVPMLLMIATFFFTCPVKPLRAQALAVNRFQQSAQHTFHKSLFVHGAGIASLFLEKKIKRVVVFRIKCRTTESITVQGALHKHALPYVSAYRLPAEQCHGWLNARGPTIINCGDA